MRSWQIIWDELQNNTKKNYILGDVKQVFVCQIHEGSGLCCLITPHGCALNIKIRKKRIYVNVQGGCPYVEVHCAEVLSIFA